jgi:hypothetical protein
MYRPILCSEISVQADSLFRIQRSAHNGFTILVFYCIIFSYRIQKISTFIFIYKNIAKKFVPIVRLYILRVYTLIVHIF